MTSEESAKLLNQLVFGEKTCVSYRLLSRLLKINVNQAKKYLQEFYDQHPDIDVSYALTGIESLTLSQSANDAVIKQEQGDGEESPILHELVQEKLTIGVYGKADIDLAKSKLKTVQGCHIYSVSLSGATDETNLTATDLKVQETDISSKFGDIYSIYGVIRNPEIEDSLLDSTRAAPLVKKPAEPVATKSSGIKQEPAKKEIEPKHAVKSSDSVNNEISTTSSKTPVLTATKTEAKKAPKQKPVNSIQAAFAKAKAPPKPPAEKVVVADIEEKGEPEDIAEETAEEKEKRKRTREELEKIFDNEDVEMEEEEVPPGSPDWDIDMDEILAEKETEATKESESEPKQLPQEESEMLVNAPPGRRRGRRKVQKRKTTTDDKGYLVTEIVDAWESFSEDESAAESTAPPANPVPTVASIPPRNETKKGKKGGQTNLLSFFGKR